MYHPGVPLELTDLMGSPGAVVEDRVGTDIDTFFIMEAIRTVYPEAVNRLFADSATLYPSMPRIEVLEPRVTDAKTLGPIMFSEGTRDGTYDVTENIYKNQFQLGDEEFEERLFLAFGDQKTASLLRSMCTEANVSVNAYDKKDWILGITALFHLRMNYLWLMQRTHYGGPGQDASTLHHNSNWWERKNIPGDRAPFAVLEELVLHSFDARVVALFYIELEKEGITTSRTEAVGEVISQMSSQKLLHIVQRIQSSAFTGAAWRGPDDAETVDDEFLSHSRYLQQAVVYKMLKYGIKNGDIGLIDRAIGICCFYFEGSKQYNYAFEMLYFKRLTSTTACDPQLRRAILSNSLVDHHGQSDKWQEVDRDLEYLNLELKRELWARRTSTFGLDELFRTTSLTAEYVIQLRKTIEHTFIGNVNSKHTVPSPADDVHELGFELAKDSIRFRSGRSTKHQAPDIHSLGFNQVVAKLESFNEKVIPRKLRRAGHPERLDDVSDGADLNLHEQIMDLQVSTGSCFDLTSDQC